MNKNREKCFVPLSVPTYPKNSVDWAGDMAEIFLPSWYHVWERESGSWLSAGALVGREDIFCWSGSEYVRVEAVASSPESWHVVDRLAIVDGVTALGIGASVRAVHTSTHWFPPWWGREAEASTSCGCTPRDCGFWAIRDFAAKNDADASRDTERFRVPRPRYGQVARLVPDISRSPSGKLGPWTTVLVPKCGMPTSICERSDSEQCRRHGLRYIETVLALKGRFQQRRRDRHEHIELRDDGMRVSPHAFRRLRRLMTSCGVVNRWGFRVQTGRNGRGRRHRRRVRLGISVASGIQCLKPTVKENVEWESIAGRNPFREARIVPDCSVATAGKDWVKLKLGEGNDSSTIVVEGVLVLFE